MKRKIIIVIVVLLVGLFGWRVIQKVVRGGGAGPLRQGPGASVAVVIEPVREDVIRDVRSFTGSVLAREQFVVAPKVAGRLEKLLVNIGQAVTNGALIAVLDSQEYDQQVRQAQAELDVARANVTESESALDIAQRNLERARELRREKVASEAELDEAEANYRAAEAKHEVALAQVEQKKAALKAAEIRLSYTRIVAAWEDGEEDTRVTGERYVDEGAMLKANEPIVSILDIDTVIAAIYVIEQDYPMVQVGQPATMTTDAFPERTFEGRIVRKAPLLRTSSRQALAEIEAPNPGHLLVPGMFVRCEIEFAAHDDATIVPVSALVRRDGRTGVFLADTSAMKARFVPVEVGIVNAESAEILAPPIEGAVVTMGHHLLEDGGAIVVPEAQPEAAAPGGTAGRRREGGGSR